jgi:predicted acetyltransferase
MPITHIHSYLVQPGKNLDVTELSAVSGTEIKLEGKIFEMMSEIYGRSGGAGDLSVRFASDSKQNDARDLIVDYAVSPTESSGRLIAERLQSFTDGTPGLGLLFLIRGTEEEGASTRTIVSRFPADVGILAEVQKSGLEIEYLEQVFMKSSKRYKAAIYEDADPSTGFWKGQVVDRQINSNDVRATADYWLLDFLASELFTTSISGSRRFGRIINQAIKRSSRRAIQMIATNLSWLEKWLEILKARKSARRRLPSDLVSQSLLQNKSKQLRAVMTFFAKRFN